MATFKRINVLPRGTVATPATPAAPATPPKPRYKYFYIATFRDGATMKITDARSWKEATTAAYTYMHALPAYIDRYLSDDPTSFIHIRKTFRGPLRAGHRANRGRRLRRRNLQRVRTV